MKAIRRALSVGAVLASSLYLACATNPVTGENELALVSEAQEIEMGREADRQIVETMGEYDDAEMSRYVAALGAKLAAVSERPELPWTFRVIDDPTVNAFALPGGFVYVTRGMMTHLTSEAQLAGILGHEIGHVTARHSVQQISRSQLASVGLGVGMILLPELRQYGDLAGLGLQLLFLRFSRDDERQSDGLGVDYMTELGYDPSELARVFGMLDRLDDEAGGGVPVWASTHPAPGDRRRQILALAERHPSADVIRRASLLHQVDGAVFGADPREGFVDAGVFHHPTLEFRVRFPDGWSVANGREAVVATDPRQEAVMRLELAGQSDVEAAAAAFSGSEGIRVTETSDRSVNGLPSRWAAFEVETRQEGPIRGIALFVSIGGRVYTLYGYGRAREWSAHRPAVEGALGTFDRETDPAVLRAQPDRLDLVDLSAPLSLGQFVDRYPSTVPESVIAVINQVEAGTRVPMGLAKRVITG